MIDVLQLQFMQHALVAAGLASVVLGVVGSLVVVNREVFVADAIAHSAYAGVGAAFLFGGNPAWLSMVSGVAAAVLMGLLRDRSGLRNDTLIGLVFAIGMAIGVLLVDLTPGYTADARSFLFGSLLTVSRADLMLIGAATVVIVTFVVAFYRPLLAYSFDQTFASTRGLPTRALELALLGLIALAVVVLTQMLGVILLISMLTIPAGTAGLLTSTLRPMIAVTIGIGLVTSVSGLALSYTQDVTSGPAIVLSASLLLMLVLAGRSVRRRMRRRGDGDTTDAPGDPTGAIAARESATVDA